MVGATRRFGWLALLATTAGLSPAGAQAQDSPISVRHSGPDTVTLDPGARGSIPFHIANSNREPHELRVRLESPAGWRVVAPAEELVLGAGEEVIRVVGFFVPEGVPAGVYAFSLAAALETGEGGRADAVVRVAARPAILVEIEEAPGWTVAGERFSVLARVSNSGNVPLEFRMAIESPGGFGAVADPVGGALEPGSSTTVRVDVTPPPALPRAAVHSLRIAATAGETIGEATARVEVVPHGRQADPPRRGIPADLRVRASTDGRGGSPVRFYAAGPIGAGRTRVEALLQGPSQGYSMFGETDVYRLRLESPDYALRLGDDVYSLSQLTEPGDEGVGLGLSGRAGSFHAGGFVQRDRRTFSPDTQYAAFVGVSPVPELDLRANWFRREGAGRSREILSAEGALRIPGWLIMQGEYGRRPSGTSDARAASLTGSRGPVAVHLSHLEADTAFGGSYGGLSTSSAHLSLRAWRDLYLEGSLDQQEVQTSHLLFPGWTHRSSRLAAGWGSRFSVEGRWVTRGTASPGTGGERSAESLRARVFIPLGPLHLYPNLEGGLARERGDARERAFWQAGARGELRVQRASILTNVEYFTGGTLHHSAVESGLAGSLTASAPVGPNTEVHLAGYSTSYFSQSGRRNLTLNASLEHRLFGGHRLGLRIFSRASYGLIDYRETIALLDYSVPLKIPSFVRQRTSSVSGRIYDAGTGAPLSRVMVRIGGRRIASDEQGRVFVSGLEPGTHYVDLDRASAGVTHVSELVLPLRIQVEPGTRSEFEIGMVRSASLSVRARITPAASLARPGERSAPEPLPRVAVLLERDGERLRRETDVAGELHFRDLRPGRWNISVLDAQLPAFHELPFDSGSIVLAPGEEAAVEWTAVPVARQVEVIGGGRVGGEAESLPEGWTTLRVAANTTLRAVAEQVYGDADLWPLLHSANLEDVSDPEEVAIGTLLKIPPRPEP